MSVLLAVQCFLCFDEKIVCGGKDGNEGGEEDLAGGRSCKHNPAKFCSTSVQSKGEHTFNIETIII
jgi:hypothetical protein